MKTKSLRGRDFITVLDFSKEELETILRLAEQLKLDRAAEKSNLLLKEKTLFLLFYNRSLRTRNSFECGMTQLGGHANYLDSEKVYTPAVEGQEVAFVTERVSDVARVLSGMGEGIAIRIFGDPVGWHYGRGNAYLREFAQWATIPVINMEDDVYHPCQAMADMLTLREKWGNVAGRKIVVSWAYSPSMKKPVSVPHSVMAISSYFGADIVFARPRGFELDPEIIARVKANVATYGGTFEETDSMEEAFRDADAVYPKSWPSLQYLPPQIEKPDFEGMKKLFEANRHWICDGRMMKLAKPDCLYMHCLPADRGFEVTDAVMDGPNSVIFDQAENRMHVQKAIMALIMR
ncbi:MAG TPA: ornithine carbamoyltransferase [Firmicutes bacterium]|nr:ornithine carbamoyltransferase [Bacillota bacterium]